VKNSRLYFETGKLVESKINDILTLQWNEGNNEYNAVKFIKYNGENYLYGVHYVLSNLGNKNPAGYLVFLRKIDEKYVNNLKNGSGYLFSLATDDDIIKNKNNHPKVKDIFRFTPPPKLELLIPFYNSDKTVAFTIKLD
jgi:hypothetical protein